MKNRVLIVTGDAVDASLLQGVLGNLKNSPFHTEWVMQLSDAISRLSAGGVDVVLLDMNLSDCQGIATFNQVFAAFPHVPILTLIALDDEVLSTDAVQHGAQGYLSKGNFDSYLIPQTLRNIIQRHSVEETFFIEKARAEVTLNSINDAVVGTDLAGNVDYLNFAAEAMTGWSREDARGKPITEVMNLVNGVTREAELNPVNMVLQTNKAMSLKAGTILIRRDGVESSIEDSAAPIHDWDGKLSGVVIVFHDISVARAMSLRMAYLAQHDFLTDLPNRLLLNDRIAQAISLAERTHKTLAVLFLDLDNFKHINDSLGHAVGDKLLVLVAERLSACIRQSDTVSRQGGDEFIVLISNVHDVEDAILTADKILLALASPYPIDQHQLYITTSIGISAYPSDAKNAETLIKNADTAMYQAKQRGRNNYQFFKSEMNVRAVERQEIEVKLRRAIEQQEFVLYYQPKFNLNTGLITGAEALIRWLHPDWGMTLPDRFVAIAEDSGLIVQIGRWVLREAAEQAQRWAGLGLKLDSIAVNISALEFRHKNFVENVSDILRDTGFDPTRLQLEITESVLMQDADVSSAILQQLKDKGIQLAVDDFGTGYSSLSYLNAFPIDVLKIDQSFVHDIDGNRGNGVIVSAIIAMGTSLNQRVVAEGIEQDEQLAFLKSLDCEEGQGFIFSPALSAEKFAEMLRGNVVH